MSRAIRELFDFQSLNLFVCLVKLNK